jgi:hypothetical protein
MHDQKFLNDYFTNTWCPSTSKYKYSGYAILDRIDKMSDFVIDIGCGSNPFKGKIRHLVGIDPTDHGADIITTIEDFNPTNRYNVALCLGSINFGDESIIAKQIEKVNSLLTPKAKVFWRLNPGQHDHGNKLCDKIDFYPWTFEKLNEFAKKYGFKQTNCQEDHNGLHMRLYAEWVR